MFGSVCYKTTWQLSVCVCSAVCMCVCANVNVESADEKEEMDAYLYLISRYKIVSSSWFRIEIMFREGGHTII